MLEDGEISAIALNNRDLLAIKLAKTRIGKCDDNKREPEEKLLSNDENR